MILYKKTSIGADLYYEVTRVREVDKNLEQARHSKDPAAGTLRQDQVCPQKAYRECLLTQEMELKVDTRVTMMELFSLCKWERFS